MAGTAARSDLYVRVTARIVAELEKGVRPWLKPWSGSNMDGRIVRPRRHNGQPYSGVNILILWARAEEAGFASPYWLTFNQSKELGAFVRKGEKGTTIVYASSFTKKEIAESGEETESVVPFLKQYCVFNAQQIDGLDEHFYAAVPKPKDGMAPIAAAAAFVAGTKAEFREGGNQAYYCQASDHIQMPPFACFKDAEAHAATVLHELLHWSKAPHRLARDFGRKKWGDEAYALEELIAELGSAFLCADLAITPEVRDDHASYLDSWLRVLRQDARVLFSAASHASKAVDYLHSLQAIVEG